MCGDGVAHDGVADTGAGEACDLGATGPGATGPPDPLQIIQAIGSATANAQGTQITELTATVNSVPGNGAVWLQCGYSSDNQCPNPNSVPAGTGVDRQGCCRARPAIAARVPGPDAPGVCRNARITVRFDQPMDPGSLGAVTDLATGQSFTKGAVLDRCRNAACALVAVATPEGSKVCKAAVGTVENGSEVACAADQNCTAYVGTSCHPSTAPWAITSTTPAIVDALSGTQSVSELSFALTSALSPSTMYRVRILDAGDDTPAQQMGMRSADGVRLGDVPGNAWRFTTGTQVCTVSRIEVVPPSYLLQRRESRAKLRAEARTAVGDAPITSISDVYAWSYTWTSSVGDITAPIAVPLPTGEDSQYPCGAIERCAFKPAEPAKNGDALGVATVGITQNVFGTACTAANEATVCGTGRSCTGGHCVGESFAGRSQLRAFICENPWPAVTNPATWSPYPQPGSCSNDPVAMPRRSCFVDADCSGGGAPCTGGDIASLLVPERFSIAYCRDQGDRKVCRNPESEETIIDARTCAQDTDCTTPQKCLPALRDDLPAFEAAPVNPLVTAPSVTGTDELRKEFFFLPRGPSYCSVSGERCDPTIAGMCPVGEFCRVGADAVGLRIYENEEHVAAPRWFAKQNFTEGTTPVEVDGYRGVQAGRTTYLNVANVGSVYTNMIVLSVNDGAVAETRTILNQILQGIRFNTNLATENERVCAQRDTPAVLVGRCSGSRAECASIGSACAGENAGTCEVVVCTSDLDCRWTPPTGTPFANGVCRSPKDKLARDVRRLEDLNEIRIAIETSGRARARCSVTPQSCDPTVTPSTCPSGETCFTSGPILAAGTFVPGLTTSRWPSWQQELGAAIGMPQPPADPLNAFGGACAADPDGYDDATCWNVTSGT
ncbi:MAG: Ig-like domain-containing protein, partial [bacterium]|nr:Ig-like domain-containing protein [bacterium]